MRFGNASSLPARRKAGVSATLIGVTAMLSSVIPPASATHSSLSGGGGYEILTHGNEGAGGDGGTREGCVEYDKSQFVIAFTSGSITVGTTIYTASPTSPIRADITVNTADRFEGPTGSYNRGVLGPPAEVTGVGCLKSAAGASPIAVTFGTVEFKQGTSAVVCSTTGGSGTIVRQTVDRLDVNGNGDDVNDPPIDQKYTITGVPCGGTSESLVAYLSVASDLRNIPDADVTPPCAGPAFPKTCTVHRVTY